MHCSCESFHFDFSGRYVADGLQPNGRYRAGATVQIHILSFFARDGQALVMIESWDDSRGNPL